jgi:hypothetical protein
MKRFDEGVRIPDASEIQVCIKSSGGKILSQNPASVQACGARQGEVCSDRCMHHLRLDEQVCCGPRSHVLSNKEINGQRYDLHYSSVKQGRDSVIVTVVIPTGETG